MGRSIKAALITASTGDIFRPVVFATMDFDSGAVYVHNDIGPLTFDGNTFLGVGDFGHIEAVREGPLLSPYGLKILLSGLDTDMMDEAENQNYFLRDITIYVGALDEDGALVDDPDQIWAGFMDHMAYTLGNENLIQLTCESAMAVFDRSSGKRNSNEQQQLDHTGDLIFEYVHLMEDAKVVWNGKQVTRFGQHVSPHAFDYQKGRGGRG